MNPYFDFPQYCVGEPTVALASRELYACVNMDVKQTPRTIVIANALIANFLLVANLYTDLAILRLRHPQPMRWRLPSSEPILNHSKELK